MSREPTPTHQIAPDVVETSCACDKITVAYVAEKGVQEICIHE